MNRAMRPIAALFLMLAACDRGPEVPTAGENRDLDEAARMLDNSNDNLSTIDEGALTANAAESQ